MPKLDKTMEILKDSTSTSDAESKLWWNYSRARLIDLLRKNYLSSHNGEATTTTLVNTSK